MGKDMDNGASHPFNAIQCQDATADPHAARADALKQQSNETHAHVWACYTQLLEIYIIYS